MRNEWTIKTIPKPHKVYSILNQYNYVKGIPLLRTIYKKKADKLLKKNFPIAFLPGFSTRFNNISGKNIDFSNCIILDYAPVIIGDHTVIGNDCKLITSWHKNENFNEVKAKEIVIGKNVWITMNCIILGGVTIGDNSIIGAGSVVTKNIPPNVFAAGNPAKVIKQINRQYKWWEDPDYNKE